MSKVDIKEVLDDELDEKNTNEKVENEYDNDEDESLDYLITEEDAIKMKPLEVIDKFPRKDEEVFKLPKPKKMSEIEGDIEVEDKERGIVFTSFYNKKERYHFNRLYDVSGEKPLLLASGDIDYKDSMFIKHYPNKQDCDDRGDYLKYMQSALYKLDKSNKPHFVAANAIEILNNGWFEQSSGKDYSVYLCKDENAGKYRRVMNFGADMSGHREVTADGTIIDELDRTDWYHKDEYKYDAKKHTLKFVKGQGYESDVYDYDQRHGYNNNDNNDSNVEYKDDIEGCKVETYYGTFYHSGKRYQGGTFVRKDGTENHSFSGGGLYDQIGVGSVLPNGLAKVSETTYSASGFGNWGRESKSIYDFKNSCYRDDLEEIRDLGDKFYAAKKTGEKQFGIYEMADEDMKNPLIMVDGCERNNESGWMINFENIPDNIIYTIGETKYRCEITPEGKLKPIAKQTSEKDLFLSTGSQWIKANLKEGTEWNIDIKERPFIRISKKIWYGDSQFDYKWEQKRLTNDEAEKFAHSIAKTAQTEKFEKLKEGYHNAKKRLQNHRDDKKQKAMTDDIKSGIAKTKERDYVHVTETDRSAER